ncbi:Lrp/AsnC family transcriptional regulator [Tropicimonas isoalkanivorans]|uniref:DNA-binding transcriptional regulator, Lrp family n=1 Tax=Tropicimonas isoalkanivorans TaxID=441112 RepID=A0A1I1PYH4_9RHOB|nr:Lrp/AsnC family transcriptional regulator [Tropicimonas isoalkanivorans]SFD14944.1 DNA-binding transcriptional regulator, Lrp family [Tropicimonas isoalkanivorans]
MDATDRKILSELQSDGRLTLTELAERVELSLSPCHRRVRALEDAGVISAYRAQVDPTKVGLNFAAIVFVTLREGSREMVEAFENAVGGVSQVVQAERLFGDPDYILHILTRDLAEFQALYDERLSALPSVLRLTSTLVMKNVVPRRPASMIGNH